MLDEIYQANWGVVQGVRGNVAKFDSQGIGHFVENYNTLVLLCLEGSLLHKLLEFITELIKLVNNFQGREELNDFKILGYRFVLVKSD